MNRIIHELSQIRLGLMTIAVCLPPLTASHAEGTLDSDEAEGMDRWDDDGGAGCQPRYFAAPHGSDLPGRGVSMTTISSLGVRY